MAATPRFPVQDLMRGIEKRRRLPAFFTFRESYSRRCVAGQSPLSGKARLPTGVRHARFRGVVLMRGRAWDPWRVGGPTPFSRRRLVPGGATSRAGAYIAFSFGQRSHCGVDSLLRR